MDISKTLGKTRLVFPMVSQPHGALCFQNILLEYPLCQPMCTNFAVQFQEKLSLSVVQLPIRKLDKAIKSFHFVTCHGILMKSNPEVRKTDFQHNKIKWVIAAYEWSELIHHPQH